MRETQEWVGRTRGVEKDIAADSPGRKRRCAVGSTLGRADGWRRGIRNSLGLRRPFSAPPYRRKPLSLAKAPLGQPFGARYIPNLVRQALVTYFSQSTHTCARGR
jgi:hypothetical protein